MKSSELQDFAIKAHQINKDNGFNESECYKQAFALILSECAEMLEADRKGKRSKDILEGLQQRMSNALYGKNIEQSHAFIMEHSEFVSWFESTVKDTFEDELADVVIRIVSFLISSNYDMQYDVDAEDTLGLVANTILRQRMSESIFDIMRHVFKAYESTYAFEELEKVAHYCFLFANVFNIDLKWHVEAKLKYNRSRFYKHGGKKY